MESLFKSLAVTAAFVALGMLAFALVFWLIAKIAPFSIRKEIAEDQNTALAILIGAIILGIAHIIASALHG